MQANNKIFLKAAVAVLAIAGLAKVIAAVSFVPDAQPVGYVGQPVASSADVSTGTAKLYSIDYSSTNWSGNLHSFPLSSSGTINTTDDWTGGAAAQIDAQSIADTRYIVTMKGNTGIPFLWAQLSSGAGGQKIALDPVSGTASASTSPILNYIRGSNTGEGTTYRTRASRLGDIIHSTPVYWDDGTNKTVFVGANDGMLHAINADNGSERFAYIPSVLMPKLSALTNTSYTHQYYVDGRLDVKNFAAPTSKTILVGALGSGGKGLYALNVTNAAATSEPDAATKVMWEITNTSINGTASSVYADLGYTYSAPTLLTLPDGTPAVVVGNGYNNTGSNGHAWLYLIKANTGELLHAFDTGSGSVASPNGLSSSSLWDTDGDGKLDAAYAGDIDGNLWKFSLVAPYTVTSLYTNTAGASQAITMAPSLKTFFDVAHPALTGVMVSFVTGRMLTAADVTDTSYHFAYGIWDGAPAANNILLEQTLTEANYTGPTSTIRVRTATDKRPDWTAGAGHHKGWKTQLPIGGERVVGDGAFSTGLVFQFFSTNPTISPTAIPPGENWWMQLNAMTGGDAGTTLFDLNGDGNFTSDDQVSGGLDPVGRNMGGGVRSQLIALSANGFDVYQSNYDRNSAPVPTTPPTTTVTSTTTGDRGISDGHFDFDVYCYTNCNDRVKPSPGSVSTGTNSTTSTNALRWSHMHEYDDIYDKTGVNLLAPSQDLHRLSRVQYGATAPTYVTTNVPNTPSLVTTKTYPSSGVTLVSSTNSGGKTASSLPTTTYNYVNGATTDATVFPNKTVSGSNVITTTKSTYVTTLTKVEAISTGPKVGSKYPYYLQTTVRTWSTVTTYVATSPNFSFKVLLSNQAYSPAVHLSLDGVSSSAYAYQATAGLTMASLPIYQLGTIKSLALEMPLDAFQSKDWGTGTTRAGLQPTTYDCVVANPKDGSLGERRNGAITVQIVDPAVTDSNVQLNVVGHPELGYRLKSGASMTNNLIAEYTIFWHHPNGKCMTDSGWTKTPPQDASSSATPGTIAIGSSDPFAGVFGIGDPTPTPTAGTITTSVTAADGTVTTTVVVTTVTPLGGSTVTTTITVTPPAGGSSGSSVGIVTGGAVCTGVGCTSSINPDGVTKKAAILGRITWREMQQ
ncbi:MAG: PilC/PilY family type IV pilus protein [Undibacterium sp.]|uniref:pilus assembly protein n=1 Tax=Undibacterium sp. TaxID=1914977 RepID=UPI00272327EA|nr:PilC/PilY family type IV pilus protein [Undibacterium sp.]MDO8651300.1 PilC/PilY family type IV pilus protein [Undibacterium sp.]